VVGDLRSPVRFPSPRTATTSTRQRICAPDRPDPSVDTVFTSVLPTTHPGPMVTPTDMRNTRHLTGRMALWITRVITPLKTIRCRSPGE